MEELGAELRRRREELGLSLTDVQAATKIRVRYLVALEAGDLDVIPGEVFVKGFLRLYADYLGLDGAAYVEKYKSWRAGGPDVPPASPEEEVPSAPEVSKEAAAPAKAGQGAPGGTGHGWPGMATAYRGRRQPPGWLGGAMRLVFLAAVGAAFYLAAISVFGTRIPAANENDRPQRAGTATTGGADRGTGARPSPPAPPTETATPANGGAQPAAAADRSTAPAPTPRVATSRSGSTVSYAVYGVQGLQVQAAFTGRCWVSVQADGRPVLERTMLAGERQEWTAAFRLKMRVGRPDLMNLTVGGVAVAPFTDSAAVDLEIAVAR